MTDPFHRLGSDLPPTLPRPEFVTALRARLEMLLALPSLLPSSAPTPTTHRRANVTPYLTVNDASAALDFYATAFGAVEVQRVTMDDGRIGHAEFQIDGARFYLSDEFPEMNVVAPTTLGGTAVTLHLDLEDDVQDVDARFAAAVDAGATAQMEPADQPHGARHGTLVDPFGHRWMLSQQLTTSGGAKPLGAAESTGGIWASLTYDDAEAGIRFMTDVLGFESVLVVPDEGPGKIAHSQLRWPEGGVVQASSTDRPGNVFSQRPAGTGSLYVITSDPQSVYQRCVAAGVEILAEPESPPYDPDGMVFSILDPERNIWSFGSYAGE